MKSTSHGESKGYNFFLFLKEILKNQTRDYCCKLKQQSNREKMFSDLFVRKNRQLYIVIEYFFMVGFYDAIGLDVDTADKKYVYVVRVAKHIKFSLLRNNLRLQTILQFNILRITLKSAICNKQGAGFLLTKYLYFRLIMLKTSYIFLHLFKLDMLYLLQFLKYSSGCRSPPSVSDFSNSKIRKRRN